MSEVNIMDNFLKKEDYTPLKQMLESNNFPWYFYLHTANKTNDIFNYQFIHLFYRDDVPNSDYFDILKPLIKQINPISLIRVKANLNPISHKLVKFDKHVDQSIKCKAAIYYINDNNGYTVIGKEKIKSKSNRIVFFDSNVEHYGTNSTNCKNRMVINFNYF
jgi:hypothetical protein|tara:strand:+ start:1800 stop:2285 length:486 start_codon:yes stop_codon:yes gene_type:complete